jgi:hypothetical protein
MTMENFSIFAHGPDLDVDGLLRASRLHFDVVWRRGDPLPSCGIASYQTSGAEVILGCGKTLGIREQERVAAEFIESNWEALQAIVGHPGVDCCILGLQFHLPYEPGLLGFCVCPCLRMMELAIDVGIRPVFYGTLDRQGDPTQ